MLKVQFYQEKAGKMQKFRGVFFSFFFDDRLRNGDIYMKDVGKGKWSKSPPGEFGADLSQTSELQRPVCERSEGKRFRKRSLEPSCASRVIKAGICAGLALSASRKGFDSRAVASLV